MIGIGEQHDGIRDLEQRGTREEVPELAFCRKSPLDAVSFGHDCSLGAHHNQGSAPRFRKGQSHRHDHAYSILEVYPQGVVSRVTTSVWIVPRIG